MANISTKMDVDYKNTEWYYPVYKCPICGKLSRLSDAVQLDPNTLPEILGRIAQMKQFESNPYLRTIPSFVPCKCDDGSAGLAQFAGLKKAR